MAYKPPKQGLAGQIFDVVTLLVLTVGALYIPLYLGLAGAAKVPNPIANPTWEALGQNVGAESDRCSESGRRLCPFQALGKGGHRAVPA